MSKFDYFNALESLSSNARSAVFLSCSERNKTSKREFEELKKGSKTALFELEAKLFSDFLPPLERDNIAEYAHALSRLIDICEEHMALSRPCPCTPEEKICKELSEELCSSTAYLRNFRKESAVPDIKKFRELLARGLEGHNAEYLKRNALSLSKNYTEFTASAGRIRLELSHCFDILIETMLNNI